MIECPFPAFSRDRSGARRCAGRGRIRVHSAIFKTFKLHITDIYDCPEQDVVVFEQTSGECAGARSPTAT